MLDGKVFEYGCRLRKGISEENLKILERKGINGTISQRKKAGSEAISYLWLIPPVLSEYLHARLCLALGTQWWPTEMEPWTQKASSLWGDVKNEKTDQQKPWFLGYPQGAGIESHLPERATFKLKPKVWERGSFVETGGEWLRWRAGGRVEWGATREVSKSLRWLF